MIDLKEAHEKITRLYQQGVKEAKAINCLTLKKIAQQLGIDADPDELTPVVIQPKGNEKRWVITAIKHKGEEIA